VRPSHPERTQDNKALFRGQMPFGIVHLGHVAPSNRDHVGPLISHVRTPAAPSKPPTHCHEQSLDPADY
jgi:hypothetical protein